MSLQKKCTSCGERIVLRGLCADHYREAWLTARPALSAKCFRRFLSEYFAGYFDAEGCVYIQRSGGSYCVRVVFRQTRPEVIHRIHAQFGGKLYWSKSKKKKHRPTTSLKLNATAAFKFLRAIRPYVVEKHDQIELLFQEWRFVHRRPALRLMLSLMKRRRTKPTDDEAIGMRRSSTKDCVLCGDIVLARGLCSRHYNRAYREGTFRSKREATPDFTKKTAVTEGFKAHVAGYFDGDGSVTLTVPSQKVARRRTWRLTVNFSQTDPRVVRLIKLVYGGSLLWKQQKVSKRGRWRPVFKYSLSGAEEILIFLRDIGPYTVEKRDQVDAVWAAWSTAMSMSDGRTLKKQLRAMKMVASVRPVR